MARSRRRSATVRTRRKSKGLPKADWVYRQCAINPLTGIAVDNLGTYDDLIFTHTSGTEEAQSHILYDSHNYIGVAARGGVIPVAGAVLSTMNRAARAEGSKPLMLRTEGVLNIAPVAWTEGGAAGLGIRLGVFEQDMGTGTISIDAAYSMWHTVTAPPWDSVGKWANVRRANRYERRRILNTPSAVVAPIWQVPIVWSGRARLESDQCWALYTELSEDYTTFVLEIQYWLRTLVVDET